MGNAVASDLNAELDTALLDSEMAGVTAAIEQLPEVRAQGFPDQSASPYGELTASGWRIDEHLSQVDFYTSAEANLPAYTPNHIEETVKQLIHTESFADMLSAIGFSEREQIALVANVINSADELALWQPGWALEAADVDDVNPEYVAPLHKRAAAGALNWIDGLDKYLYQNEVLITESMLDAAAQDIRAMLGGFYLLSTAAKQLGQAEITDEALSALVSGSSAIMIANQNNLQSDLIRISDKMRAPPRMRGD